MLSGVSCVGKTTTAYEIVKNYPEFRRVSEYDLIRTVVRTAYEQLSDEAYINKNDMMDKYNIGYGSVNHNRNRCLDCGYENSTPNLEACPKCGSKHLDKLQRITGYLVGTTDRWNNAKLSELNDRVTHN